MSEHISIANKVYEFLSAKGIVTFFPAQMVGECLQNSVVVKYGTTARHNETTSNRQLVELWCYTPKFSDLEAFCTIVKNAIKQLGLQVMIRVANMEDGSYYDEDKKAHLRTVYAYFYYKR